MNEMTVSRLLAFLFVIAIVLPCVAQTVPEEQLPQVPQSMPELVPQTTSGMDYGGGGVFGAGGQWFAAAGTEGDVLLYDLIGGRVSHRFPNTMGHAHVTANPSRNLLAIAADESAYSAVQVYDVDHGVVLWKTTTKSQCSVIHFSADGSRLLGVCSGTESLLGWNTQTGALVPVPALPEGYVGGAMFSEDGRWLLASRPPPTYVTPSGKPPRNPFTAYKMYQQAMKAYQDRIIVDTETGHVVTHLSAYLIMAISAKAHTAVVLGGVDVGGPRMVLVDVLNPSANRVQVNTPYAATVQTTHDGTHFVFFAPGSASLVDANTGEALHPRWEHVPYLGAAAVADDGDQVAFAQSGSVSLFRFSQSGEGRFVGNAKQAFVLTVDSSGKLGSDLPAVPEQGTPAPVPTVAATAPIPASKVDDSSTKLPTAKSALAGALKDMIPIYGSVREARKRKQAVAAPIQQASPYAASEVELGRKVKAAVLKFGGPIMLPPEPAFIDSGRLMAVRSADSTWGLWDVATGNHIATQSRVPLDMDTVTDVGSWLGQSRLLDLEKRFGVHGPDVVAGQEKNTAALSHSSDGQQSFIHPIPGTAVSEDPADRFKGMNANGLGDPAGVGLRVVDAAGQTQFDIPEVLGDASLLCVAPGGHVLVGADRSATLGLWDRNTGVRLGSLTAYQEGEWLLTTPSGLFDGSPRGWQQIAWRDPNGGNITLPGEAFFSEFYYPGLLAELLEGHVPQPPRSMARIDRRQPSIRLIAAETATAEKTIVLNLKVKEAGTGGQGGGVRDVRLFRNDVLVRVWRGEQTLESGETTLSAVVPLTAGENKFVAYAFNRDNVKSLDETMTVRSTQQADLRTAYIVAIGVNRYSNTEFNLKFATPDATHFSEVLGRSLKGVGQYDRLVQVNLLDEEATKENIRRTIDVLSGRATPGGLPPALSGLQPTKPQDTVILYFAGHGIAFDDHFYLIPHDLGFGGARADISSAWNDVLAHGISDLELEEALDPLDSNIMLIIDACNSGKALDADDARRGPMNSKGLAQLAYEKGMYVLTASQAYQAALESSKLGHGYLTYALTDEGLQTSQADTAPIDGQVSVVEWFEYASRRVPQMQNEALNAAAISGDRKLVFEMTKKASDTEATANRLQTPRLYYRREQQGVEPIVSALPGKQEAAQK